MAQPKIFYFCYDHQTPTGGQKQMYRHIDILNKHGHKAFALHTRESSRLRWFDNKTAVVGLDEFEKIYHSTQDFLVLPEDLGTRILSFPGQKIIFNQNCYYGFYSFGFETPRVYPYVHPDIKHVFVVSDHNLEYLTFAFPDLRVSRIYYAVDSSKFVYRPIEGKKKLIACLPSKNPMEVSQVYHQLLSRSRQGLNRLQDYEWVFIQNRSEAEVIRILSEALLLVFLSTEEGFGILPLEAMASGTLVVAYDSGPPSEYLRPQNAFLFKKGDVLAVVRSIEEITGAFPQNVGELQAMSEAARDGTRMYSLRREEESVIAAWHTIMSESDRS